MGQWKRRSRTGDLRAALKEVSVGESDVFGKGIPEGGGSSGEGQVLCLVLVGKDGR